MHVAYTEGLDSTSENLKVQQSDVWTGLAGDDNWNTPGNWSCGFVPGDFSDVFIKSGDVTINSNVKINSLTSTGGKLTLTAGYTLTIKHFGSN